MVNPRPFKAGVVAFLSSNPVRNNIRQDNLDKNILSENCFDKTVKKNSYSVKLFDSESSIEGFNAPKQITSPEKVDSILQDVVALSSVPEGQLYKLKALEKKDVHIKEYEGAKNYGLKTPDGSFFELKTLAKIDKEGFRARSIAVHPVDKNGNVQEKPSSVRIAFGGTSTWSDMPRTITMAATKLPLQNYKHIGALINKTSEEYKANYVSELSSSKVVVSAHSAGTTHAMHAYEQLNEMGVSTKLRLYEPYGAKFMGSNFDKYKDIVSYRTHNSFLQQAGFDGDAIGLTEYLPPSQDKDACNGAGIIGGIEGHKLICVASLAIDKERNKLLSNQTGVLDIMYNITESKNASSIGI
jgi:hypothetical protein